MSECREDGFVLVATLWFVALLALTAIIIEGWISVSLDRGNALSERIAARSALLSAEQRVAYTLATATVSPRGLELVRATADTPGRSETTPTTGPFIALDDRPYEIGGIIVRLQDGAGLFDINSAGADTLRHALAGFGLSESAKDALAAALVEYRSKAGDVEAARRHDSDYARGGLPSPRHAPLLTPWELLRVIGWAAQPDLWRAASPITLLATLGPIGGVNLNTAPALVISTLTGIDQAEAARMVAVRSIQPLTKAALNRAGGSAREGESEQGGGQFMPANVIRLVFASPSTALLRVIEVRLDPMGKTPVRVDYALNLPRNALGWRSGSKTPWPGLEATR